MIKKATGLKFTPEEFRKLEKCASCLKASPIEYGQKCEICSKINFRYCSHCECVLREGLHQFYSYDNRDNHRDADVEMLPSKELIREFVFEEILPPLSPDEIMCEGCKGWKSRIKDICFWCDNDFFNNEEHYKLNGNSCEVCVAKFQE